MKFIVELKPVNSNGAASELTPEQMRDWLQHYAFSEFCGFQTCENIAEDPMLDGSGPFIDFQLADVSVEVVE